MILFSLYIYFSLILNSTLSQGDFNNTPASFLLHWFSLFICSVVHLKKLPHKCKSQMTIDTNDLSNKSQEKTWDMIWIQRCLCALLYTSDQSWVYPPRFEVFPRFDSATPWPWKDEDKMGNISLIHPFSFYFNLAPFYSIFSLWLFSYYEDLGPIQARSWWEAGYTHQSITKPSFTLWQCIYFYK